MKSSKRILGFLLFLLASISSLSALEPADQAAIRNIIQGYTDSWNLYEGKGFGDGYTDDADFVNIFGMHFTGKAEIEARHEKIIQTFFKGSKFHVTDTTLREVQPGLVVGLVRWKLEGFRLPGSNLNTAGETREGIYTQVFVKSVDKWEITASQNTLIPVAKP